MKQKIDSDSDLCGRCVLARAENCAKIGDREVARPFGDYLWGPSAVRS